MARGHEQQRGRLAALQSIVAVGGQVLLGHAQSLADGVHRRLAEVGRGVGDALEDNFGDTLDELISRLSVSLRRDLDGVAARLGDVEERLAGPVASALNEALEPVRLLAQQAIESAAASRIRLEELASRLESAERHLQAPSEGREAGAGDAESAHRQLDHLERRLLELGREVGTRVGEVTGLAERLGRLESRLAQQGQEQGTRAADLAALRERLSRLEARLSDLSREQVARAVEAAGLRERVFRLEQRLATADPAARAVEDEAAGDEVEA